MPLDSTLQRKRKFKVVGTRPLRPDGIDKVTGRAKFGADATAPGMLVGPHPALAARPCAHPEDRHQQGREAAGREGGRHARRLPGSRPTAMRRSTTCSYNIMAREKALYEGHAVAAVAAVDAPRSARAGAEADQGRLRGAAARHRRRRGDEAGRAGAARTIFTDGVEPEAEEAVQRRPAATSSAMAMSRPASRRPTSSSSAASRPRRRTRAISSRMPASPMSARTARASSGSAPRATSWCATPARALLGMDVSKLRVTASEIGGGFGGKTTVFIEPVALALSRKANRPVKVVMSREEVFKATGPTVQHLDRREDRRHEGRPHHRGRRDAALPGRRLRRLAGGVRRAWRPSPATTSRTCARSATTWSPTGRSRPPIARPARRWRPSRSRAWSRSSARRSAWTPIDFRHQERGARGHQVLLWPDLSARSACCATLEAAQAASALQGAARARTRAAAWPAASGSISAARPACRSTSTSTARSASSVGTPDIGGSRASMCLMAAEELGIPYEKVRAIVADTSSLGYNDVTDGSRITFATGMATHPGRARRDQEAVRAAPRRSGASRRTR